MRKLLLATVALALLGITAAQAETSLVFGAPFAHAAEGKSTLPKEMVGEWCYVKDSDGEYERRDCRDTGDGMMTLDQHHYFLLEDGCDFTQVQKIDRGVYYVHGACSGEGMTWNDTMIIQLLTHNRIKLIGIRHSSEKSEG